MKNQCKKNIHMQNISNLANTAGYVSSTHTTIKNMQNLPHAGS